MAEQASVKATKIRVATKHKDQHGNWFRGDQTNYNPKKDQVVTAKSMEKFILKGWLPEGKPIKHDTQITAFGSCFANNISKWLTRRNFRVLNKAENAAKAYVVSMGEGMVNSFAIRQQFEWAWENKKFDDALWHGYDAEEYGYDDDVRLETKRIFDETDVFVLTFGLSEVWYDEVTQNVFWRAIPQKVYDPDRHKFRVSTVQENRDNIEAIYQLVRKHRPNAKIIVTLSPIPLIATFRDNSCLTSNSVSKSVLRVALDEVVRAHKDEGVLHYWPTYELITDIFAGSLRGDRRHVRRAVLEYNMTLFEHYWCDNAPDNPPPNLDIAFIRACASVGQMPWEFRNWFKNNRKRRIKQYLESDNSFDVDGRLDKAKREYVSKVVAAWDGTDVAMPEIFDEDEDDDG